MSIGLILSVCFALISGFIVLVGNKNKKTWKEAAKSLTIPIILVIVCTFLFMTCMTTCIFDTGYDSNEFNWDGKPKDQYRHMRKPILSIPLNDHYH